MTNIDYEIDYSDWFDEGGYCQVYSIKNHTDLVFKEFRNKTKAVQACAVQKKLAKFDLAPQVITPVCQLRFTKAKNIVFDQISDWGYVTEYAKPCKPNSQVSMKDIQYLVDQINSKTGLKFWDCHWYNIGLLKRGKKNKIVCIDTGKESFDGYANAWGNTDPGPKCRYCLKYKCSC